MNLKKTLLSTAIAATLSVAVIAPANADIVTMNYDGLFTMLDSAGSVFQNKSYPYYGDTTWAYGLRTQVKGTMTFDLDNGSGSGTVTGGGTEGGATPYVGTGSNIGVNTGIIGTHNAGDPNWNSAGDPGGYTGTRGFDFSNDGQAQAQGIEMQSVGGGIVLGNMTFKWAGNVIKTQIALDANGLFSAMAPTSTSGFFAGTPLTQAVCASDATVVCATPAADNVGKKNDAPIGPVPISTSSFNVNVAGSGDPGYDPLAVTIADLSLGIDDGIGGTPMDNGPFSGFNANFDLTSIQMTSFTPGGPNHPPAVPVPAAVWLFGSGLLGLVGVARRRKQA